MDSVIRLIRRLSPEQVRLTLTFDRIADLLRRVRVRFARRDRGIPSAREFVEEELRNRG